MLNSKTYDILKWVALIAIPAVATFCGLILPEYGVENVERIVITLTATGTLLGTLLGVSSTMYNKSNVECDYGIDDDTETSLDIEEV